jgi:arylsulfatase A-like enzyme
MTHSPRALLWFVCALTALLPTLAAAEAPSRPASQPDVILVTIDTLRADRMSGYGYSRPTSPNLDELMKEGVRFSQARTVEPLTGPAMCSVMTAQHPHEHGASRNGLRMRAGLPSLPGILSDQGYATAGFISNWTLRHKLSGLGEHFQIYEEVLKRKRWFGLISSEANADDINDLALAWLAEHRRNRPDLPFFLWVHYTEPHAPYRLQKDHTEDLGIEFGTDVTPSDRYDTEIAFTDRAVGDLLAGIDELIATEPVVVFASDHGESLGEHGYWGHGRNLQEPNLLIPMSITWKGHVSPQVVDALSLNIDIAPTLVGLLGLEQPPEFNGYDWTPVLNGKVQAPTDRVTSHQAHRGAVLSKHDSELARKSGLLEVAVVHGNQKEMFRVKNGKHTRFDLSEDPGELKDLTKPATETPVGLRAWFELVTNGLGNFDDQPPEPLDPESIEQLRALGYAD